MIWETLNTLRKEGSLWSSGKGSYLDPIGIMLNSCFFDILFSLSSFSISEVFLWLMWRCLFKFEIWENCLSQPGAGHAKGFSCVCLRKWLKKLWYFLKMAMQPLCLHLMIILFRLVDGCLKIHRTKAFVFGMILFKLFRFICSKLTSLPFISFT